MYPTYPLHHTPSSLFASFAPVRVSFNHYRNLLIDTHRNANQLTFLKSCRENKVLPPSLLPRRLENITAYGRPYTTLHDAALTHAITSKTQQKQLKQRDVRRAYTSLHNVCRSFNISGYFGALCGHARMLCSRQMHFHKISLTNKLSNIFMSSTWCKFLNFENIVNLFTFDITWDMKCVLSFGLSFVLPADGKCIMNFLTNFNKYEKWFPEKQNVAKGYILNDIVKNLKNNFLPTRFRKALISLKMNKDVIITRADKGNKVVILDQTEYFAKLNDVLSDSNTYCKVAANPLKTWQRSYNKKLKEILCNFPDLCKRFSAYLPSLPYMYGLPKIHKPGNPRRPIVSSSGSITYNLSKWLASLLSPLLGRISGSHLVNSEDFIKKVKSVKLDNKIMLSFDVDSLFTNVPIDTTIAFLRRYLSNNSLELPFSVNTLISLIEICVEHCYFSCNGDFFNQTRGLPMGSCLSPILSNIFMEYFEKELLPSIVDFEYTWFRYVDDVFAIIPATVDINEFLAKLNSLSESINFKVEVETGNQLPFLDTLVIRSNNTLKFKVYRKPTHSNLYIHAFSGHSDHVKLGAINSIFLRAYKICDREFLDEEICFITQVFKQLGYDDCFIEKAHSKAKKVFYTTNKREVKKYEKVVVLPSVCEGYSYKTLFHKDVRVVFNNNSTTRQFLRNPITKQADSDAGIYAIPCEDCPKKYIGESDDIERRMYQHQYDIKTRNQKSPLVKHTVENNHSISVKKAVVLNKANNVPLRKLLESVYIKQLPNMNVCKSSIEIDNTTCNILFNHSPSLYRTISNLDSG